ncbi:MAG TPA: hypothetical protein VGO80_01650 [Solirubrobacteraceae bacterium]|jgi:hypothetical protein|nr:hypothetical protein [Solirubrobacteraceae bacterium]
MFVDLAVADRGADLPPFVIARLTGRCGPAGLTRPMRDAVPPFVGMDVLLVQRDRGDELRTYGDGSLSRALAGVDLDSQCWQRLQVLEAAGHTVPALYVGA